MARIATIIGKDESGSWHSLGVADGNEINKLVEIYKTFDGIIKRGKAETRLSEMRILCSSTAGGELKAKRVFQW